MVWPIKFHTEDGEREKVMFQLQKHKLLSFKTLTNTILAKQGLKLRLTKENAIKSKCEGPLDQSMKLLEQVLCTY